jgi:DNA polymerase-1
MVSPSFLERLKHETSTRLSDLTSAIYEQAGTNFNINSTKQLGVILFETLELPVVKKTKTGYSTDEKVLNKLYDEHPIIPLILNYRELFKLYSTYIDPLLTLANEKSDHRIHTSFLQTGTATGRLSSKNPNLQNIPVKNEEGRKIRQAFVAPEGKTLIGIDYSQIELRLLAHFSNDPTLLEAFSNDRDIHLETAKKLFGDEEATEKRSIAKTVNFGLLYGMGSKKLSETLGITTKEAKIIITNYFEAFISIESFMKSIEKKAQETGYSQTLYGRRRYFDFANASPMQLAAFKREAVNTVFQGSAADLIKKAMNKIQNLITTEALNAKLLLQIHDELIFEVNEADAPALASRFQTIMETIETLNVPLQCSVNIAKNWGELK